MAEQTEAEKKAAADAAAKAKVAEQEAAAKAKAEAAEAAEREKAAEKVSNKGVYKAAHRIVYGDAQVAEPGTLFVPAKADLDHLLAAGAIAAPTEDELAVYALTSEAAAVDPIG